MALLFLIRHGENEYTRTGKLAGWTENVTLNEAGQKQAQGLVERLSEAGAVVSARRILHVAEGAEALVFGPPRSP